MNNKQVDILLSVYNPNEEYLIKQLISLNNQTYPNLKLYIFDDCIKKRCNLDLFEKYITNFSYEVLPYCEENLNYMGAFEKLVQRSDGEYIAFCDQDDIWMDDKVEKCVAYMNEKNIDLVVTDKQIIDENDNVTCSSVRKHSNKNYDNWNTYDDITKYNIFVTYAVGMSIIMKASFAKKSLPFSKYTGHDKWVLACTSTEGKVGYLNLPLVQYRRHGKNVSGVLVGIETKEDYINQRIMPDLKMIEDFKQKYPNHKDLNEIEKFANGLDDANYAKKIKAAALAIIEGHYPPKGSNFKYPAKLDSSDKIIQGANAVSLDRLFLDFRNDWGITDILTNAQLREMISRHRYAQQDLDDTGQIRDILAKAATNYKQLAYKEEIQKLSKIKYRNGLREAIYKLADNMLDRI